MATILLIDSDTAICEMLQLQLEREGHTTIVANDGEQGLQYARDHQPDLVILDVALPKLDGFAVCRILRFESDVPILFLTARQCEADRVMGLDLGADDYITKPFLWGELLAHVRALLRRRAHPVQRQQRQLLEVDALTLDLDNRRAFLGDTELSLAQKEFDLLACFMQNRGVLLSREALLEQVWGEQFKSDIRTVDVHIRWLRAKIEPDSAHPYFIQTVRGVGYRFTAGQARHSPREAV